MTRLCTAFVLFELALLGSFLGLPAAQADPAEECCGLNRNSECTGCVGGYNLPPGCLFGCASTGVAMGCEYTPQICNEIVGPVIRWKNGSKCHIYQEMTMELVSVEMPGCPSTECN